MPRPPAILAFLAALALLIAPVANVATAGIRWGTVICCCGEHDGDHDCGCPECPSGHHPRKSPPDDGHANLRSCSGKAHVATPATMAPYLAPAPTAVVPPAPGAVVLTAPALTPPARVVHPITPPS